MPWSIPIGVVAGTAIRIHVTFLLLLLWIGVAGYSQGGRAVAVDSIVYILCLFGCVLLHELGHVFAARRYGIRTPDITLLPIGGVASLERIPEKPAQEFVVAIAGPLVNLAIAALLLLAMGGSMDLAPLGQLESPRVSLLARLAAVNVFLALFNLIPAFPMDGGRILRALLAIWMGRTKATQIAATIGQAFAFLLGFLGLFGNPMLIFIAIFVFLAASSEASHVQLREVARTLRVADAMITRFATLGPSARIAEATELLLRTTQKEFPVVDGGGALRGLLTRDAMIRALQTEGPQAPVLEAMTRDIPTVGAYAKLDEALRLMTERRTPAVGVLGPDNRLVGLITPENVGEMMMVRAARPEWSALGPWARRTP